MVTHRYILKMYDNIVAMFDSEDELLRSLKYRKKHEERFRPYTVHEQIITERVIKLSKFSLISSWWLQKLKDYKENHNGKSF